MTWEEFDALPISEAFSEEVVGVDEAGRKMIRPVVLDTGFMPTMGEDEPFLARDREGNAWTFGYIKGVLHKRHFYGLD